MNIVWVKDQKEWEGILEHKESLQGIMFLPEVFQESMTNPSVMNLLFGSRFSAKTETWCRYKLWQITQPDYSRIVFARMTQKQARDKTFQLFQDIINNKQLGWKNDFEIHDTKMQITCKSTGNKIIGGSFSDPDNLMGAANVTEFGVDEPISWYSSIQAKDFETIQGSFRNDKGITPVFYFMTNPINKDNFIYTDLFDEETRKFSSVSTTIANYYDNPFCPKSGKDYLDDLKIRNYTRWLVDGAGQWGDEQNDSPYFVTWTDDFIINERVEIDPNYELWISFDFNYEPCTAIIAQFLDEGLAVIDTVQVVGGTEKLCNVLVEEYKVLEHPHHLIIAGDDSGYDRRSSGETDFAKVQRILHVGARNLKTYPKAWKRFKYRYKVMAEFFEKIPTIVNKEGNEALILDLRRAVKKPSDEKYKSREKGHGQDAGDAFEYMIITKFDRSGMIQEYLDYIIQQRA